MGSKVDCQRRANIRRDTDEIRKKVETTREWIFERGLALGLKAVDRLLAPRSLVPTRVG
jgi:hypothetical protein